MRRFWHSGDSTSKRVLDVLESFYLRQWKIIVQCVAVVKFRVNDRNCSVCKYVKYVTLYFAGSSFAVAESAACIYFQRMTYNVFGGTLSLTQSINPDP